MGLVVDAAGRLALFIALASKDVHAASVHERAVALPRMRPLWRVLLACTVLRE